MIKDKTVTTTYVKPLRPNAQGISSANAKSRSFWKLVQFGFGYGENRHTPALKKKKPQQLLIWECLRLKRKCSPNHLCNLPSKSDRNPAVLIQPHSPETSEENVKLECGSVSEPAYLLVFKVGLSDYVETVRPVIIVPLYAQYHFLFSVE